MRPALQTACILLAAWALGGCDDGSSAAGGSGGVLSGDGDGDATGTGGTGGNTGTGGESSGDGDGDGDAVSSGDGDGDGDGDESGTGGAGPGADPLSTDRGDFFGDSRCAASPDLLFCDDFEQADIDAAAWDKQGNGTVVIDSSQQARGASSAHVHADGNGFAFLRHSLSFPVQDNRYYGRMFVRFDELPTAPLWAHWTIAEASGTGDGSLIRVGGQWNGTLNRLGVGSDGGPTGDWTDLDGDEPPPDTWICVEWLHDGQADVTRIWWDAVELPSLATTANDHGGNAVPYVMPEFESVWVGWWLYQGNPTPPAYDVWIDAVALDDERIGCVR